MPGGDRTGPQGMGSRTGRGAGFCAGFNAPGYANPAGGRGFAGRGFGCGRGGGRGRRQGFFATGLPGWMRFGAETGGSQEEERSFLENQAQMLQTQLDGLKARLAALTRDKNA